MAVKSDGGTGKSKPAGGLTTGSSGNGKTVSGFPMSGRKSKTNGTTSTRALGGSARSK